MSKPDMIDLLSAGIAGASARQNVIAGNIANAQTPGFHRRTVEFQQALAKAIDGGAGLDEVKAQVRSPSGGSADETGNNVDLETEIGDLIANSANYKACLRILNKVYKQMELAMNVQ
jgi:flagellar basal-body rod protein FlgB